MIHDLDLVLHLTGGAEATEVRASGLSVLSPHLDLANARVEFAERRGGQGHGLAGRAGAGAPAPAVPAQRLLLARPGQRRRRIHAGPRRTGGRAPARELADVVERIALEAPEADALALELAELRPRGAGRARGRGDAARKGRAALALALRVADAVRRAARRRRALDDRAVARRASSSPPASPRGISTALASSARSANRYPDADDRAFGGPAHGGGGRDGAVSDGGLRGLRRSWKSSTKIPAHCRLLRALRARLPRRPLRPRHPHRLSRLSHPGGRSGASARAPRCCTTSRRSSGPGGRAGRGGSPRR